MTFAEETQPSHTSHLGTRVPVVLVLLWALSRACLFDDAGFLYKYISVHAAAATIHVVAGTCTPAIVVYAYLLCTCTICWVSTVPGTLCDRPRELYLYSYKILQYKYQ